MEPATVPHAHDPAALADDAHAAASAEAGRRGDLRNCVRCSLGATTRDAYGTIIRCNCQDRTVSAAGERGHDGAPAGYLLLALLMVLSGLGGTALGWCLALASGEL